MSDGRREINEMAQRRTDAMTPIERIEQARLASPTLRDDLEVYIQQRLSEITAERDDLRKQLGQAYQSRSDLQANMQAQHDRDSRDLARLNMQIEHLTAERDKLRREVNAWQPKTGITCETCGRGHEASKPCEWCAIRNRISSAHHYANVAATDISYGEHDRAAWNVQQAISLLDAALEGRT